MDADQLQRNAKDFFPTENRDEANLIIPHKSHIFGAGKAKMEEILEDLENLNENNVNETKTKNNETKEKLSVPVSDSFPVSDPVPVPVSMSVPVLKFNAETVVEILKKKSEGKNCSEITSKRFTIEPKKTIEKSEKSENRPKTTEKSEKSENFEDEKNSPESGSKICSKNLDQKKENAFNRLKKSIKKRFNFRN